MGNSSRNSDYSSTGSLGHLDFRVLREGGAAIAGLRYLWVSWEGSGR